MSVRSARSACGNGTYERSHPIQKIRRPGMDIVRSRLVDPGQQGIVGILAKFIQPAEFLAPLRTDFTGLYQLQSKHYPQLPMTLYLDLLGMQ